MASKASTTHSNILLSIVFFVASFIATCVGASETYQKYQDSVRVKNLPGQPSNPPISQFSGYITVNQDHGRALFYWFFEAQSQPSKKPLLLWLNGGPGCSSIGYGAASELGPLRVNKIGAGLQFNEYAWNKEANLLFVESPVGVGFSYTNTSSDLTKLDDGFVAEDAYNFLVGNPETDDYFDSTGLLEYAWSHAVISDQLFATAKQVCDFRNGNWSKECANAMIQVFQTYREIDIYNIYAPSCLFNTSSSSSSSAYSEIHSLSEVKYFKMMRMRIPGGGYDPCYSSYAEDYFNRLDVQSSLHANRGNASVKWKTCNGSILRTYNFTAFSVLPIYSKLIKGGLRIWIYSGDTDGRVPVIGSRYCVEALSLPLKSAWRSWFHQHQVGGRVVEYEGLTFVTVRGAGHLVPLNKPSQALQLIHSFLYSQNLPTH
ncbi:Peptidase S10, serine carboxypeptidase [Dillenia turbinata]|uniref:Peptidase S10, serine carboxypeptidase n=1 Tax=Dillenia turbinata TaxID=194707 RepID=A0AAN8YV78_9MAGN